MGRSFVHSAACRARLQAHLDAHVRHVIEAPDLHPAAVAVTLVPDERGETSFLLTRRAAGLSRHGGQFALPGGRIDAGESHAQASLRELSEELGVKLKPEHVLGVLDDFATRSGFVIAPVVLWSSAPHVLCPNPAEVAVAYRVPIRALYEPSVPVIVPSPHGDGELLSLPILGTHVHSPTAAIVYQLRQVAFEGLETRVHHYAQPQFAWR